MNRRSFIAQCAVMAALLPELRANALDVDVIDDPILEVFRILPGSSSADAWDFPVTTGINGPLQRSVWPENPDMYWDPEGEDYSSVLGFYPSWMEQYGFQEGVSLWQFDTAAYGRDVSRETLISQGWEVVDQDLHILRYTGNETERGALAESLNVLGGWVKDGLWDWVALPDDTSVVIGNVEDRVRIIADRVKHNTSMSTIDQAFPRLDSILRPDSYNVSLLPPQRLPVEFTTAAFLSRSWTGDTPILQSIGLCLETQDQIPHMIGAVEERLDTQTSTLTGTVYSDFLQISDVTTRGTAVRFDLIDANGEWNITHAEQTGDLGMLPFLDQTS